MPDLQNSKGFLFIKYVVFYLSNVKFFVTRTLSHELSQHALFSMSLQLVWDIFIIEELCQLTDIEKLQVLTIFTLHTAMITDVILTDDSLTFHRDLSLWLRLFTQIFFSQ